MPIVKEAIQIGMENELDLLWQFEMPGTILIAIQMLVISSGWEIMLDF